ncbi:Uncharacterized protein Adt_39519 [Abeliophyllum distichum]|uniref:Uncharacterized protein n=1 Tax=Abeliophyllum distichum TaxID=126358 RepID=A0ABD1Q704_9LAMI
MLRCPLWKSLLVQMTKDNPKNVVYPSSSKEAPLSPKAAEEDTDSVMHSIQALFTSWEQVKASFSLSSSFATRPSTSFISSTKDMNTLKKSVLVYTSFIDKDISRVNIDNCKLRLVAKKRNISLEIEQTKALTARYSEVAVDDPNIVIEELSIVDSRQGSEWSKHGYQMRSILERLDGVG